MKRAIVGSLALALVAAGTLGVAAPAPAPGPGDGLPFCDAERGTIWVNGQRCTVTLVVSRILPGILPDPEVSLPPPPATNVSLTIRTRSGRPLGDIRRTSIVITSDGVRWRPRLTLLPINTMNLGTEVTYSASEIVDLPDLQNLRAKITVRAARSRDTDLGPFEMCIIPAP